MTARKPDAGEIGDDMDRHDRHLAHHREAARRLRHLDRSRDKINRLYTRLGNPPLESDEAKQVAGVLKGVLDLLREMVG